MYRLQISYPLQNKNQDPLCYMQNTDKRLNDVVGTHFAEAGCGFGTRDACWSFDTKARAAAAFRKIKALKVPKLQGNVIKETEIIKLPAAHHDPIKYMLDGNKTIKGVVAELRGLADHFEKLAKQGAELTGTVDGGWICYEVPGHEVELECDEDGEPYEEQNRTCTICYKGQSLRCCATRTTNDARP